MSLEFLFDIGQAFVPKRLRPMLRSYLMMAGIDDVPFKFFGGLFFGAVFFTIISYFYFVHQNIASAYGYAVVGLIAFSYVLLIALAACAVIIMIIYFYLNIKIYNRTKELEDKLVDFLTLVSTNLKGGLSFEKSLWLSIKPEFEILAKEMGLVSKKVMTGNDLTESLQEFAEKYDSPTLKRAMNLIIGEVETGGRIVNVIDKVIINLRKTKLLKEEMAANTVTYMIFIGAIVLFIAPALFALSAQLLKIIIGFAGNIGASSQTSGLAIGGGFALDSVSVDPKQFESFSRMALASIAVASAVIISIVEKGDIKGATKYAPIFLVVALILYEFFRVVLGLVFSGIIA